MLSFLQNYKQKKKSITYIQSSPSGFSHIFKKKLTLNTFYLIFFIFFFQNTVDKLVQRANASLLIGTSSWKEQFLEAITVSAGKSSVIINKMFKKAFVCIDWIFNYIWLSNYALYYKYFPINRIYNLFS